MFIVFSGLPGTGKSTIAARLAGRLKAAYLRIDSIEQAIRSSGVLSDVLPGGSPDSADVGPAGYIAACRLADENLRLGLTVIADSVNPLKITRDAYRDIAERAGVKLLEIELVCSDAAMHRQRVETRASAVEGLRLPTWEQVETRHYETWDRPVLLLDTGTLSVAQCIDAIVAAIK